MLMNSLKDIIDKYVSIGVSKEYVIEQYTKLKVEILLKERLKGSALETKVYKILEDKFLELLEGGIK